MSLTVKDIAEKLGATFKGDGDREIHGLAGIDEAGEGDITFVAHMKYAGALATTRAAAVVVKKDWQSESQAALVFVDDPDRAFGDIAELISPDEILPERGIHPTAVVADAVELGQGVAIGAHCVIERGAAIGSGTVLFPGCYVGIDAVIGCDCKLYPNVTLRETVKIGDRAIVHNGAVIGSDGFGYSRGATGWIKIRQVGTVVIGDDVEIGANTTIDRARFGETVIGDGVKLDNQVQVAHNCRIGDGAAIAALVGMAGTTFIGKNVQVGGQAGFGGHLTVGDGAIIAGRAGVIKDVPAGAFVSGFPAIDHRKESKIHAHVMRLPLLKKKIREMEERIEGLENR